MAATTQVDVF